MIKGRTLRLVIIPAAWTSNSSINSPTLTAPVYLADLTPDIGITLATPEINDNVTLWRSTTDFATYDAATDNITSLAPVNPLEFNFGGNWAVTTWKVKGYVTRNGENSPFGNTITFTLDTTAPTLTLALDDANGWNAGTGSVTTDEASGNLYYVLTSTSNTPTADQILTGKDYLGANANISGVQAVTSTGVQTITGGFTGLTELTTYYAHYMHRDYGLNMSTPLSANGFTTGEDTSYIAEGVIFDGTNDWMARGGELTGVTSGKLLTTAFWFKSRNDSENDAEILTSSSSVGGSWNAGTSVLKSPFYQIAVNAADNGGTKRLDMRSSANKALIANGWLHFMLSVDMSDNNKRHLYLNDVSDANVVTYSNTNLDYTTLINDFAIGGAPSGGVKMSAELSDFYYAPGQYIDLSVEANRRKFITAGLRPVDLGSDGSIPTGTAPAIYYTGNAASWAAGNRGTGGNFTVNGALTDSTADP